LGATPLANALLTQEDLAYPETRYPLNLYFCPSCSLLQISEVVSPRELFGEYLYLSSFSDTVLANAESLARRLVGRQRLGKDSLVVEVASNDGYLLKQYQDLGIQVLGVEPARNIAKIALERGVPTIAEFFGPELAEHLTFAGQFADVLHANNVLAHVPDLNGFVKAMALVLKEDGLASVEVPYVKRLVDDLEFDTIYHEHLSYFSVASLKNLFERHKLIIVDVERLPVHGGSLRVLLAHHGRPSATVKRLLLTELEVGLGQPAYYENFADRVRSFRQRLLRLLKDEKRRGHSIAAYGASAKGTTLLNYCGVGSELVDYVVDRSTIKHGLFTPGTHLPICPPEVLMERRPDLVLLLTWNLADEILGQQKRYRELGGRFLIPFPTLRYA
jgi:SAM-dependent methyltransferase